MKLIPRIKIEKYPRNNIKKVDLGWAPVLGVEFTKRDGLGIGIGIGLIDIWIGWPKKQENLHYEGCLHSAV